jgi:hypothetical protein
MKTKTPDFFRWMVVCNFILLFIISKGSVSQTSVQQRIGTVHEDFPVKIVPIDDSTYFLASSYNDNNVQYGFVLIKMDMNGQIRWSRLYSDTLGSSLYNMILTTGNTLLLSSGQDLGNNSTALLLTSIDTSGGILWNYQYSYVANFSPSGNESLIETHDHHYLVSVYCGGAMGLMKTDTTGNVSWTRAYRYDTSDYDGAVAYELQDGSLLFTTSGFDAATGQHNFWMLSKLDSVGNVIKSNNFTSNFDDVSTAKFHPIGNGNFLLITKYTITYINSEAEWIWQRNYHSNVLVDNSIRLQNGKFAFTGLCSYNDVNGDVLLMIADTAGNILSAESVGGLLTDVGRTMIEHANGIITICGNTRSFNSGGNDAYLLQTDSTGSFGCNQLTASISNPIFNTTYLPDSFSVSNIVINQSPFQLVDSLIHLSQDFICTGTGISDADPTIDPVVYPNPFSRNVNVTFNEQVSSAEIIITNAAGGTVKELKKQNVSAIEIQLEGESGVYFMKVIAGNNFRLYRLVKM